MSGREVSDAGIESLPDLAAHVPNLFIGDNSLRSFGDTYSIRGQVNTPFFSDPSVVLYVDDVAYGNAFSYSTELIDIERIDVFRGPHGHLFGKNNSGGVIQIYSRKPIDRSEANAGFTYGSYDLQRYRAGLMGPIVSNAVYFGAAGVFAKRDGILRNGNLKTRPDTEDGFNGRFFLTWAPSEEWEATFTITGEEYDDGTQRIVPLSGNHFQVASDFDGETQIAANSQSLRVRHSAENFVFTSVTARRDWKLDPFTLDLDLSPFVGNTASIEQQQEQWSQELRLQSPPEAETWKWLAGFYFSTSEIDNDSTRNFFIPPPVGIFATGRTRYTREDSNYALFGQVTCAATEKLDISLGTRLDYTVRHIDRTKASTLALIRPIDDDEDFFNAAPKLTFACDATEDILVYGSTGLGFKPGGFSGFVDPPSSPEFDTEYTWANEIGVKSAWCDKRCFANVSLFYYKIWDYQVERPVPGSTDLTIVNADEATSFGAEAELTATPLDGLELTALVGTTWIEFDRYKDPSTGATLDGNRAPFVPEFNLGLAAQYRSRSGLFARTELHLVGDTYFDDLNTQRGKQSSYALVHAKAGYESKHFAVYVYGNNLTDREYFTNKRVDLSAGVPGEPLTVGVETSLRY